MQKPTRAGVYPRVTQLCPKAGEETCWLTQLPDPVQNTCAIGWCCSHHHKTYIQIYHLGIKIVIPLLHVFLVLQYLKQAPESQNSQGYQTRICFACISFAPKKSSRIRNILDTGDSSDMNSYSIQKVHTLQPV